MSAKRFNNALENPATSSEESESSDYPSKEIDSSRHKKSLTRKPQCFSRNALIARENRRRKKLYMENLEKEVASLSKDNKKLSTVVDNQSFLITDLRKEIKYLRSALSNSPEISKLLRNIHQVSGMSVSTSLDSKTLNDAYVSNRNVDVSTKNIHPWEIVCPLSSNLDPFLPLSGTNLDLGLDSFPLDLAETDFPQNITVKNFGSAAAPFQEHDYSVNQDEEDVGVCLHISKQKLSLEFCSTCSDAAQNAWKK